MSSNPSELIQIVGRLHPLLVHLPIGFIILLAVVEGLTFWPRFKQAAAATGLIALLSVPVVICSAACGWVLSWSGGFDEQTLAWHKWLGTALVPAVIILAVLQWRGLLRAYRICLVATVVLLSAAGHFGGSLTHGSDYLFRFLNSSAKGDPIKPEPTTPVVPEMNDASARQVYAAFVDPIFREYCVNCHGPDKSKGKLRLDTVANVFKGGESGPIVQPGAPARSLLIKRILLPEEEDEHMPPAGKRQLSENEIALLKWWVTVGTPLDKTVGELKMPEVK